ncbi:hypothetical protein ACWT_3780 [Actinoplanes sp. SE50]|nr:hypothetical protein ACPL_3908 [Actinoplanes sp. SE50/110]ATO83195.1 hypothetical protein ACWT_3780 [Actinoplanes sp. SE50]SLM00602.1 hypothetical protein ACSP50_3835 [Actinoplanes sp. SE50/110]
MDDEPEAVEPTPIPPSRSGSAGAVLAIVVLTAFAGYALVLAYLFSWAAGNRCVPDDPGFFCTPTGESLASIVPMIATLAGAICGYTGMSRPPGHRGRLILVGYLIIAGGLLVGRVLVDVG